MSYDAEKMDALRIQLREFRGLVKAVEEFNKNVYVFERLASAIEKQNELKEQELGCKALVKTPKK